MMNIEITSSSRPGPSPSSGYTRDCAAEAAGNADGPFCRFLAEAYAEIILIEHALRQGRMAVVAVSAGRLARVSIFVGAKIVGAIAADLGDRARVGDVVMAGRLVACLEKALAEASAAPIAVREGPERAERSDWAVPRREIAWQLLAPTLTDLGTGRAGGQGSRPLCVSHPPC
jgi:hypothetical protein